ncbi:ankyrin repeat domain-containing protein 50-like [Saccostrea cucullata]|uniref:ankyrin repeat domain-containing protein 50-like n=1 Tax=Saccostrea cuccullata TaxID=36930 RepID=UPI002ED515EA
MKEVENEWNICQISNMEELLIEDKLPNSVQRLIIFDHPFGKTSVNILNLVYFLLHKNNFCQLEGKTKVIMTCRSNIFEEIIAFPIDVLKNVIYMTKTYLGKSPGLLKEINEAVNVQSGLTQNDDDGENEYLPRLCNHIGAYFSESQNHVYDFYTLILLARQENLILKKSLLNAQKNISQVLEINIPEKTFSEGIKSAIKKSKYLRRKRIGDNTVCFCEQECILDAFICHLLKKDPQLFLKCAGNKVICSHVCPFSASDDECWRLPDTEQFQTLSKRLHEYLTSDDMCSMSNVIKVPYWKNDEFINVFIDVLSQDRMTDILYCSKRYPIFNGRRNSVVNENSNKTNEQCAYIWNETELLRFELLFTGQSDPCSNGFTVLSTHFVYWTISYGRYEAIDQILRLAIKQNSNQADVNRCILLACFRSVDILKIVLEHLKTEDLTNVRFSKSKALFFNEQATILPLHVAIAKENLDLVNVLVEKKVLVNECDHKNRSALLVAMEKNYTDIAETLLKIEGLDVNTHDIRNRHPLHLATMKGDENFVKILLDKKAKVDCVDENDVTPLNTASTFGFKDITEMLLKGGAKLNKFDNNEKSPLINALENGHIDVIGLLMQKLNQKSMDLNHSDVDGRTPLFVAVDKCYFETTKRLVKLGADVNVFDSQERTPLYLAAEHNSLELVKYLIEKGSQSLVNKGDENHKTPLHVAIEKNNLEMVDHLVKYGADVNSCDDDNKTPLHVAIENFQNSEILEYLLRRGARVDIPGNQRIQSPLFLAITMKNTEAFDVLARSKADLNKMDDKRRSLLCYAVESNEERIVRILLHKKVEVNTADEPNKMTPLHYAADKNLYDIVKLLVKEHANINATDSCGRTPLHIASRNGNFEIVEHLVRNGADVNKADFAGDGPWEYAFEKHRKEIMMYLAKRGAHLRTEKT